METLYFILGVLSVVALAAVVSMFKIKSELKQFTNLEIAKLDDHIGRRIVELERDIYRSIEDNETRSMDKENKLYGYIDSRNDKLADNVSKYIADINKNIFEINEHLNNRNQR